MAYAQQPAFQSPQPAQPSSLIRWSDFESPSTQFESLVNAQHRVAWRLTRLLAKPKLLEGEPLDPEVHRIPRGTSLDDLALAADKIGASTVLPDDAQNGCEHLWGLVHPDPKRRADWPSLNEIVNYESKAIRNALAIMSRNHSAIKVFNVLIKQFFLTEPEARALIILAKRQARTFVESEDPEEARSLMILRTQQVASKAAKAFNTREEMNALKLESQLRGLTRTEGHTDGIMDIFAKVIGEGAAAAAQAHPTEVRDLGHTDPAASAGSRGALDYDLPDPDDID